MSRDVVAEYLLGKASLDEAVASMAGTQYSAAKDGNKRSSAPNPVAAGQAPAGLEVLPAAGYAVANDHIRGFPHHSQDVRDPNDDLTVVVAQAEAHWRAIEKAGDAGIPGFTPAEIRIAKAHLEMHLSAVSTRPEFEPEDPEKAELVGQLPDAAIKKGDPKRAVINNPRVIGAPRMEAISEALSLQKGETVHDFTRALEGALELGEGGHVEDVLDGQVVVTYWRGPNDGKSFAYTYQRDTKGKFTFGDPVRVRRLTKYDPVTEAVEGKLGLSWLFEAKTKREQGYDWPASAFAYVPDSDKPSTWKLRVKELVDGKPKLTTAQLGRAAAAFSSGGFRGKKVQLPSGDVSKVKAKLRSLYKQLGVKPDKVPTSIKESSDGEPLIHEDRAKRDWGRAAHAHEKSDRFAKAVEFVEAKRAYAVVTSVPSDAPDALKYAERSGRAAIIAAPDLFPDDGIGLISEVAIDQVVVASVRFNEAGVELDYWALPMLHHDGGTTVGKRSHLGTWAATFVDVKEDAGTVPSYTVGAPKKKKRKKKILGPLAYTAPGAAALGI